MNALHNPLTCTVTDCPECFPDVDVRPVHYHVNTFQPGCLNDASEGPFDVSLDALEVAGELILEYRERGYTAFETEPGRWEVTTPSGRGLFIVKVEACREECDDLDSY